MIDPNPVPTLRTPGVIATELDAPLHRVVHVLRTRPQIRPSARAGTLRLYDRAAVELVRQALDEMHARRAKGAANGR